jgi:L-malate glycosyltransferase
MEPRIKVLEIIKSLGRGGAEMLLSETLRLHDQSKFEFHYMYFLPWKNQLAGSLESNGGKVVCMKAKNNIQLLLQAWKVSRYIKENDIKLIHAHLPWAGILSRLVGRMTGIPVLYTEHNKQERYHFLTRHFNLSTMHMSSLVIPVSGDVEESIKRFKPALKIPLKTVLNGVNIQHFQPSISGRQEIKDRLQIPNDATVITTIAVFRFQKRLDLWLEIAKQILTKEKNVHFIIVGDGPLKEKLNEKIDELNLKESVHMVGLQTEVRPYLAASDIYMMTSIFEGLPIALLEAMAFGLPVITTSAGGIKEVIDHGQDGLLCAVDNWEELVNFALRLIRDKHERLTLGLNARTRISQHFSMETMVNKLEELYSHYAVNQ